MRSLLTNSGWDGRVCKSHRGTQAGGLPTPPPLRLTPTALDGVCADDRSPLAMLPFSRAMAAVRSNLLPGGGERVGAAGRARGCGAVGRGNAVAARLAAQGHS